MQFSPQQIQYDRAKTIFSPDGRLFQVEYAREAVNRGATSLGITFKDGVVLAAVKTKPRLQVDNPEKVFRVENHIGVATAGLVADGRILVDESRMEAQRNMMIYDEPIPVYVLAKYIADKKQMYTQYAGVRPFGSAMIVGGITETPRLFQTDPSGILKEWQAIAIGRGSEVANKLFEKEYKSKMSEKDTIQLAVKALSRGEAKITLENIELAVVKLDKAFKRISSDEMKAMGVKV